MLGKIPATIVAAMLLASTGSASAQSVTHAARSHDPYAGTVWASVVPYGSNDVPNPYAGTVWDGVAPH
jgi:hypothetical protein